MFQNPRGLHCDSDTGFPSTPLGIFPTTDACDHVGSIWFHRQDLGAACPSLDLLQSPFLLWAPPKLGAPPSTAYGRGQSLDSRRQSQALSICFWEMQNVVTGPSLWMGGPGILLVRGPPKCYLCGTSLNLLRAYRPPAGAQASYRDFQCVRLSLPVTLLA